jgi:hypothetical protein
MVALTVAACMGVAPADDISSSAQVVVTADGGFIVDGTRVSTANLGDRIGGRSIILDRAEPGITFETFQRSLRTLEDLGVSIAFLGEETGSQ